MIYEEARQMLREEVAAEMRKVAVLGDKHDADLFGRLQIPGWYAMHLRRQRRQMLYERTLLRLNNDSRFAEFRDRLLRDTRPDMVEEVGPGQRQVIVIGAGRSYYEDLRDQARRTMERPDPKYDPALDKEFDLKNDIDQAVERRKAEVEGRTSPSEPTRTLVFSTGNNPLVTAE